jgi:hypothetical protein
MQRENKKQCQWKKAVMKLQCFAAVLLISTFTFSCKKDNGLNKESFYGKQVMMTPFPS